MQYAAGVLTLLPALVGARDMSIYDAWKPPGPGDARGPCPMLNTMANHGFIPHNGYNFTLSQSIAGFAKGLNFGSDFSSIIWHQGLATNPTPNATQWNFDQLSRHNVLEKDGSLSRTDAFFGSNRIFNATVYRSTTSWWKGDIIDRDMLVNSKLARQLESRRDNPTYTFTNEAEGFSTGELASLFLAFGDREQLYVNRSYLDYFFTNERFPVELGWVTPAFSNMSAMAPIIDKIEASVTLLTEPLIPNEE